MSSQEVDHLLHRKLRNELPRLGSGDGDAFLQVYGGTRNEAVNGLWFCAIIPDEARARVMNQDSWDLSVGDGGPGFVQHGFGEETTTEYRRQVHDVEPLVLKRSFHGLKPDTIELAEEFRLFHELFHDQATNQYVRIDMHGEEHVVAKVTPASVHVDTRHLRQFLAARGAHLAVFFDIRHYAPRAAFHEIPPAERKQEVATPDLRYHLVVDEGIGFFLSKKENDLAFSILTGKKLVPPLPLSECGRWPYENEVKKYADFIVGRDEHGNPIYSTCDEARLDRTRRGPGYLTPILFRREVLKKYYDRPEKYVVNDGIIYCGSLWSLDIDNDSPDHVGVFLGDLGKLGHDEQLYWRSFNIPPHADRSRNISATTKKRAFEAEFADPTSPDLVFKNDLERFQAAWEERFGWELFRRVRADDEHNVKRLRIPLNAGNVAEFEDMVLVLAKLLVDGLNDSALAKELGGGLKDERSISKLQRFLEAKEYPEARRDIDFLRLLYDARSAGVAHRKGNTFKKISKLLEFSTKATPEIFSDLLRSGIAMLAELTKFFLVPAPGAQPTG